VPETVISTMIIEALLQIIRATHPGTLNEPVDEHSQLDLVEIRPKSEGFADVPLSCSISPNDPADSEGWVDEENIAQSSFRYNPWSGSAFKEMGSGQFFNIRFIVDFTLFFQEMGLSRDEAMQAANLILARIHRAIQLAGSERKGALIGLRDSFGTHLINPNNAVKKRRMLPRGSDEETFYKGKLWLQFDVWMEP
jgi:hypothetical protein